MSAARKDDDKEENGRQADSLGSWGGWPSDAAPLRYLPLITRYNECQAVSEAVTKPTDVVPMTPAQVVTTSHKVQSALYKSKLLTPTGRKSSRTLTFQPGRTEKPQQQLHHGIDARDRYGERKRYAP